MDNKYNSKYLKYKNKYLNLKKIIGGGIGQSTEATTEATTTEDFISIRCYFRNKESTIKNINLNISLIEQLGGILNLKSSCLTFSFGNIDYKNNETPLELEMRDDAYVFLFSSEIKHRDTVTKLINEMTKYGVGEYYKMNDIKILVEYDTTNGENNDNELLNFTIISERTMRYQDENSISDEITKHLTVKHDLTLQNLSITELPVDFGNITVGRDLIINGTRLKTLPESFGNITVGRDLIIQRNSFRTLPESLKNINVVRDLTISHNYFEDLPDWFKEMRFGRSLDLQRNELKTLPDWFSSIVFNGDLNLSGNKIASLPENFGYSGDEYYEYLRLKKSPLKVKGDLNLNNNSLTTLPESFGYIDVGRDLNLSYNHLITLPDSISNIRVGRNLDIRFNYNRDEGRVGIKTFPKVFFKDRVGRLIYINEKNV